MEYEEVLVNGEIVKVAVKVPEELNPDNYPLEEDIELLYDTADYSSLYENTIELEKGNEHE